MLLDDSHGLVFKGGTALRLCSFEDYRCSAHPDFSRCRCHCARQVGRPRPGPVAVGKQAGMSERVRSGVGAGRVSTSQNETRSQMTNTTRKLGAGSREVDTPRRRWSEAQKRRIVSEHESAMCINAQIAGQRSQ